VVVPYTHRIKAGVESQLHEVFLCEHVLTDTGIYTLTAYPTGNDREHRISSYIHPNNTLFYIGVGTRSNPMHHRPQFSRSGVLDRDIQEATWYAPFNHTSTGAGLPTKVETIEVYRACRAAVAPGSGEGATP
jgi:hypothetical protein